ncbi:hypothetical protein FRC03_006783, partial [Tulasnella sp. 419]
VPQGYIPTNNKRNNCLSYAQISQISSSHHESMLDAFIINNLGLQSCRPSKLSQSSNKRLC